MFNVGFVFQELFPGEITPPTRTRDEENWPFILVIEREGWGVGWGGVGLGEGGEPCASSPMCVM